MSADQNQTQHTHHARCVIWRAVGAIVPAELRGALDRRGVWAIECDNASWAIAELCRMHADEPETPVILLLLDPNALQDVEEVINVAERYAPHATAWIYQSEANPPLRAVPRPRREQRKRENHTPAQAGDDAGLRLTEPPAQEEPEKPDNASKREVGQDSPSVLSRDELASLKHPDQVDGSEA